MQPLGTDDPTTPLDESRFIPVAERFTAGGDTSHRAYPLDLLGTLCDDEELAEDPTCQPTLFRLCTDENGAPRACGNEENGRIVPLGGNSIFIFNAEYRLPIFAPLGGAVFVDAGNVFAEPTIDVSNLLYGAGVGVRYLSPVGPLRFDIGWPLDRRPYDRTVNYSITLGYAF